MSSGIETELFTLLIVVLVVARFLVRELQAHTVRLARLWIRPTLVAALLAFFIVAAASRIGLTPALLLPSLGVGLGLGVVVGVLVAAATTMEPTQKPGVVRLRGSWVTVAIWVAALAFRIAIRFAFGMNLGAQSAAINSGTLALVVAAFATFAVLIVRRARERGLWSSPRSG